MTIASTDAGYQLVLKSNNSFGVCSANSGTNLTTIKSSININKCLLHSFFPNKSNNSRILSRCCCDDVPNNGLRRKSCQKPVNEEVPGSVERAAISAVRRISLASEGVGGILGGRIIPPGQSASRAALNAVVIVRSWKTCCRN